MNNSWTSVKDELPSEQTLVWIHGIFHGYDGDFKHTSIGMMLSKDCWQDLLDPFPTSGDTEVHFWMPIEFPKDPKPVSKIDMYLSDLNDIRWSDNPDAFNNWRKHCDSIYSFFSEMSPLDIMIIASEYGYRPVSEVS